MLLYRIRSVQREGGSFTVSKLPFLLGKSGGVLYLGSVSRAMIRSQRHKGTVRDWDQIGFRSSRGLQAFVPFADITDEGT